MARTLEGSKLHTEMVNKTAEKLRTEGWGVATYARLPSRGVCDILAERNQERLIVECLLSPTPSVIKRKKRLYSNYGRFILLLPESYSRIPDDIEVWTFSRGSPLPVASMRLSKEVYSKLLQVKGILMVQRSASVTFDDTIEELIKVYDERRE